MMIKRKLNIAIFHLAFIYSGGGEKLVLQEYDGLKKRGHKVKIFTTVLNKKKSFPDILSKYKIKTFLPNFRIFNGHEAFLTVLSCVLAPFYAFKFKKYDCILACNQPSPWIAFVINKLYGVPYVSYIAQPTRFLHPRKIDKKTGLFFTKKASESIAARLMMTTFRGFSNWADKISIKGSDKILVNGEYVQHLIEKIYKVKSFACPPGVIATKNVNFSKSGYLLVTNRHFPQKRIEYAIFALNSLHTLKPKFRLIITGSNTEYTQSLRELVDELGLPEFVDFVGYKDEKELKSLYRYAAAYLYTAPEEDFGMGIVEAMANGAPVISWDSSGPSKIINNNIDGVLAKPFNSSDFTNNVIRVVTDKKLSNSLTKNAIYTVTVKYSQKVHINTVEDSLLQVIPEPLY